MRDFNADGVVVGRPYQEIYEQSLTQKYPIGMIHERHGRRWRYSRAYETIALAHRVCPNMALQGGDTGGSTFAIEKNLYATAKVGESIVLVETTVAYAKDYFVDGLMTVFSTGLNPDIFCLRVSGNDLGNGTYVKIYLDEPLPVDMTVVFGVNVNPSSYQNVGDQSHCGTTASGVVVPSVKVTSGYFFWGQTKGPAWVTPTAFGGGRMKMLHSDGCIIDMSAAGVQQLVGVVIARSSNGTYGDGNVNLMLE